VYGGGPVASPVLYEADRVRLRLESGGLFEDVPRTAAGTAIIGDPRNDENMIVSGLHAAFIAFHNEVVAQQPPPPGQPLTPARRPAPLHIPFCRTAWLLCRGHSGG
jgi:hypothetical protein